MKKVLFLTALFAFLGAASFAQMKHHHRMHHRHHHHMHHMHHMAPKKM